MSSGKEPSADRVVFFDDQCALCEGTVALLRRLDRRGKLRFAPLAFPRTACTPGAELDSIIYQVGERRFTRSDAVIEITRSLGFPWSLLGIARVVPRAWRDTAYDWVARRRHRLFGRKGA